MEYLYICCALIFTTLGQLLQKISADRVATEINRSLINAFLSYKETWFAIASLAIGMMFWLAVLYRMDVATAYPFLSINLILVMFVSHFILKENITKIRIIGSISILLGILLVTAS